MSPREPSPCPPRPRHRSERGLAVVETALLLTLLLLLLFSIVEYGWMFVRIQEIGSAAHAGARVAARVDATTSDVTSAVDAVLADAGISGYTTTLSPADPQSAAPGTAVSVRIELPYSQVRLTSFPLPMPSALARDCTMVREGSS